MGRRACEKQSRHIASGEGDENIALGGEMGGDAGVQDRVPGAVRPSIRTP
jgi:hypothetical protein